MMSQSVWFVWCVEILMKTKCTTSVQRINSNVLIYIGVTGEKKAKISIAKLLLSQDMWSNSNFL